MPYFLSQLSCAVWNHRPPRGLAILGNKKTFYINKSQKKHGSVFSHGHNQLNCAGLLTQIRSTSALSFDERTQRVKRDYFSQHETLLLTQTADNRLDKLQGYHSETVWKVSVMRIHQHWLGLGNFRERINPPVTLWPIQTCTATMASWLRMRWWVFGSVLPRVLWGLDLKEHYYQLLHPPPLGGQQQQVGYSCCSAELVG